LTNNDLKLIKYLYECEFLTRKQIYDYVLSDITNRQVRNILSKLKSFNFIKYLRNPFQFSNEEYIYVVDYFAESSLMMTGTFKQFKKMCDEFNLNYIDLDKYRMFKTETFNNRTHDYFLNNVRFMLEDIGAKNWIPEYIIRQNDSYKNNKKGHIKKVPDGIIKGTNNIAIELERTLKTPSRYLDIFNKYKKEKEEK